MTETCSWPVEAGQALTATEYLFRRIVAEAIAAEHEISYADPEVPPDQAFDLEQIFNALGLTEPGDCQYMVFFTSGRKPDADEYLLEAADANAHNEAANQAAGGLNLYVRGEKVDIFRPDGTILKDRSRSCCAWDSEWQAKLALNGPNHQFAASIARAMYSDIEIGLFWVFRTESGVELVKPDELNEEQEANAIAINRRAEEQAASGITAQAAPENSIAA